MVEAMMRQDTGHEAASSSARPATRTSTAPAGGLTTALAAALIVGGIGVAIWLARGDQRESDRTAIGSAQAAPAPAPAARPPVR